MKLRIIGVALLVAVLAALVPAAVAAADDDPGGDIFEGVTEGLPGTADFIGDWTVSGTVVHVTSSTVIEQEDGVVAVGAATRIVHEGRLSRGSTVRVFGSSRPNGSIKAARVVVRN